MSHNKKIEHHVRPYKLLAQSVGLFVCGFFLLFVIGEGIPDLLKHNNTELYYFLPMVLLPVAGYVITWVKEKLGATIIVAGAVILLVYFLFRGDVKALFIYSVPFLVSGGLFFLHIKKRSQLQHHK